MTSVQSLQVQGEEKFANREFEEALNCFEQALKLEPENTTLLNYKASALNGLERYQESLDALEKAIQIQPDLCEVWGTKGKALELGFKQYEEALFCYEKAIGLNPSKYNLAILLVAKADIFYNLGQYQKAIEAIDQALENNLESESLPYALYEQACCYALLQKQARQSALESLKKAMEFDVTYADYVQTDPDFQTLYADEQFQGLVVLFKGVEQTENEEFEAGLAAIDRALQQHPDFSNYFVALNTKGHALSGLERYEDAIAMYDLALQHPADAYDSYTGWSNKGYALTNLERYEEALACHDKALEWYDRAEQEGKALQGRNALAPVWDDRGWDLIGLERYDEAIQSFDKALECNPKDGWLFYSKACCYALQNRVDSALESLERAIALEPEAQESAKTDSDLENLRSDKRFQAMVGMGFDPETVRQFFTEAFQKYAGERGFVDRLGNSVSAIDLPSSAREAYTFYKKNVEDADFGGVGVYQVAVEGASVYAVEVTTEGDDGWLELYSETGDNFVGGRHDGNRIKWGDKATVRADLL